MLMLELDFFCFIFCLFVCDIYFTSKNQVACEATDLGKGFAVRTHTIELKKLKIYDSA